MAAGGENRQLSALEERLRLLEEEVGRQRLSQLAAEDEATKILEAADNLPLQGEERGRRRALVQRVAMLLDRPEAASCALCLTSTANEPAKGSRSPTAVIDDLLCAADHLLAEMAWLCKLTQQAIANNEALTAMSHRVV